jgi:hypothetical protein
MKILLLALVTITLLTACGEPEYIVYGSKEFSVLEHKIKTTTCEQQFDQYNSTKIEGFANPSPEGYSQDDSDTRNEAAKAYDICHIDDLIQNDIQLVERQT